MFIAVDQARRSKFISSQGVIGRRSVARPGFGTESRVSVFGMTSWHYTSIVLSEGGSSKVR